MRENHNSCGHSHIRCPVTSEANLGCEEHLGENHQKLAIPAGMSRESGESARHRKSTGLQRFHDCYVRGQERSRGFPSRKTALHRLLRGHINRETALSGRELSSPPCPRSDPMNSFERAVQRGLIRESTPNGDVGQGQPRIRHKISGPVHAALDQPPVRRRAKGLLEGPGKVADGQFTCFRDLLESNIAVQASLQKLCRSSHLQGRESASKLWSRYSHTAI